MAKTVRDILSTALADIHKRMAPITFPTKDSWKEFSKLRGGLNEAGLRNFWPAAATMGVASVWIARLLLVAVLVVIVGITALMIRNGLGAGSTDVRRASAARELVQDTLAEHPQDKIAALAESNEVGADVETKKKLFEAGGAYPGMLGTRPNEYAYPLPITRNGSKAADTSSSSESRTASSDEMSGAQSPPPGMPPLKTWWSKGRTGITCHSNLYWIFFGDNPPGHRVCVARAVPNPQGDFTDAPAGKYEIGPEASPFIPLYQIEVKDGFTTHIEPADVVGFLVVHKRAAHDAVVTGNGGSPSYHDVDIDGREKPYIQGTYTVRFRMDIMFQGKTRIVSSETVSIRTGQVAHVQGPLKLPKRDW